MIAPADPANSLDAGGTAIRDAARRVAVAAIDLVEIDIRLTAIAIVPIAAFESRIAGRPNAKASGTARARVP